MHCMGLRTLDPLPHFPPVTHSPCYKILAAPLPEMYIVIAGRVTEKSETACLAAVLSKLNQNTIRKLNAAVFDQF